MPPPRWQQLQICVSYSKITTSESRSSCFVSRSTVKREIRGLAIFVMRRWSPSASPGCTGLSGLKVGKYWR